MYSIYDTREPEGNGGAVIETDFHKDNFGKPLTFETHDAAVTHAVKVFGEHDVLRVVIAGSPE